MYDQSEAETTGRRHALRHTIDDKEDNFP